MEVSDIDGAKTIIGTFKSLTDATYFLARQASKAGSTAEILRKESVYFQTKTQQNQQKLKSRKSKKLKLTVSKKFTSIYNSDVRFTSFLILRQKSHVLSKNLVSEF